MNKSDKNIQNHSDAMIESPNTIIKRQRTQLKEESEGRQALEKQLEAAKKKYDGLLATHATCNIKLHALTQHVHNLEFMLVGYLQAKLNPNDDPN